MSGEHRRRLAGTVMLLALAVGCGPRGPATPIPPEPDTTDMEAPVAERLQETRAAILENPRSAGAWGRFGMVAHAHELWSEAELAYVQAEALAPEDPRWPYFRADVLSVVATDLSAAEGAFRRALELRPSYAPAHMRLGRVLQAAGRLGDAAAELERALELAADLEPARVTLAQIRLAQGELDRAAELLLAVLEDSPRHEQALSTLAQVYQRQGRRKEAREVAARTRDAAAYNLFEDPLMSEVVAEGVSSAQIWERAKSFFEVGDYEQAARGLRRVVELTPDNADAHLQLAVSYGNLGEVLRSRYHLDRAVALDPESVAARVKLAMVDLERGDPAAARPHLRAALALDPDHPEAPWLLARAQIESGDLAAGLATYESAAARAEEVPVWARNEWGSALAGAGRGDDALRQFRSALAQEPTNPRALFSVGLVLESRGRLDEAVDHYCRSLQEGPHPPPASRLRALGRTCH